MRQLGETILTTWGPFAPTACQGKLNQLVRHNILQADERPDAFMPRVQTYKEVTARKYMETQARQSFECTNFNNI